MTQEHFVPEKSTWKKLVNISGVRFPLESPLQLRTTRLDVHRDRGVTKKS